MEPDVFIQRTLISAIYVSLGIAFILFLFFARSLEGAGIVMLLLIAVPFLFMFSFFYFFQFPSVKIKKLDREVNKEIIFAGRFLVVELESGVTLYGAMKNLAKNYPAVGYYFNEIIIKVDIGTTLESAISETIDVCPSHSLTKILWQISNSLKTGGDVAEPLNSVIETLIKEQQILVNEYAKKLNPLAMFYMLIAIIMPSLGVTLLTIISIFVGLKLNLVILLLIACANGFIQFMFVAMINSIRPPVEL